MTDYLQIKIVQSFPIPLDVTIQCQQHELIVLVGPSGSGKTTLLRTIAGLYKTTEQSIVCNEQCWSNSTNNYFLPVQKRRIGMVFQHYALFPHLSVLENIEISCENIPAKQRRQHADTMLQKVNLDGLQKRYPSELSGGQQQRVALARALARQPDLLLLDEPFSAVDQVTRRKLRRELAYLRQQLDFPIILVTHDLDEARMLADRICILHDGTLLQSGTPDNLLNKPDTAQVARLIDMSNIFSAVILRHDADKNMTYLDWQGLELECDLNTAFAPGSIIDWVIPPDSVILHRRDRPSRGERENPVTGTIKQAIQLGETTAIVMQLDDKPHNLSFNIPTHVARRNRLVADENIRVSLLASAIHLMNK